MPKSRVGLMHLRVTSNWIASLASLTWLLGLGGVRAQPTQPSEYQIKAAFLFNFAKFVEWPATALPRPTSPLVIGLLGPTPFGEDLARTIRGKSIDGHPLVIKEFSGPAEVTNCHILFISTSEKKRLPEILAALKGASVLTVGETERFAESGGMINFFLEGTKIRFQINQDAASQVGLKISSKLMSLASRPGGSANVLLPAPPEAEYSLALWSGSVGRRIV
jgi:hypothetical protein